MPPVLRIFDPCTPHPPCYLPSIAILGSPNVLVNCLPAHRQGDLWLPHFCPIPAPPCVGTLQIGLPTVLVNGKMLGRLGDPISCKPIPIMGSPNVLAG